MARQWYYTRQGEKVGPVPEEELRVLLTSRQIASSEQVWAEGWEGRLSPQRAFELHFSQVTARASVPNPDEPPPFPPGFARKTTPSPGRSQSPDVPPPFPPSPKKHDQSAKTTRSEVPSSNRFHDGQDGFDMRGRQKAGSPSPQQDRPLDPGASSQGKVSREFHTREQDQVQGRILSLVRSIGKSIDLARNASVSQRLSGNVKCKVVRKTDGNYDTKNTTSEGDAVDAAAEIRTLSVLVREHGGMLTDATGREVTGVLKEARDYTRYANLTKITGIILMGIGILAFLVGWNIGGSVWFGTLIVSPFVLLAQYVENRLPFSRKCWKQIVNALEGAVGDRAHDVMYSAPGLPSDQGDWHPEEPSEQRSHSHYEQQLRAKNERQVRFYVIGGLVVVGIIVVWLLASTSLIYADGYTRGKNLAQGMKHGWEESEKIGVHVDTDLRRNAERGFEDVEAIVGAAAAFGANNANTAIPYPPGSFDRRVWVDGWRNGVKDGFK